MMRKATGDEAAISTVPGDSGPEEKGWTGSHTKFRIHATVACHGTSPEVISSDCHLSPTSRHTLIDR